MDSRDGNPLLRPDADAAWAVIGEGRREAVDMSPGAVAERLMRAQRLSAQAAQLRRAAADASERARRP